MTWPSIPRVLISAVILALLPALSGLPALGQEARYVGAEVCGTCHSREDLGRQFQRWTGSMHARSYLALATGYVGMIPEEARGLVDDGHGRAIAREAKRLGSETNCLLCHSTGFKAGEEEWEPSFHLEDGVQCEACHGPGSIHVEVKSSGTGERSGPVRLQRLTRDDCKKCHREKPSHAVLERPPFDYQKAWKKIAHPLPASQ